MYPGRKGEQIVHVINEIDSGRVLDVARNPYFNLNDRLPPGDTYVEYDVPVDKRYSRGERRGRFRLFVGKTTGAIYYNMGNHDGSGPDSVQLIRSAEEKDSWKPAPPQQEKPDLTDTDAFPKLGA